jgi:DNA-directed RNA polymerase specialized sigma24 family protein
MAELIRANIRALYDNVRLIYPLADTDRLVYDTFVAASRQLDSVPVVDTDLWLLGVARRRLLRDHGEHWFEDNSRSVVDLLRNQAAGMADWHVWQETVRTIAAIERMAVADREVLRLVTCVDGLDGRGLALVLGVPTDSADARIERAVGEFRREFDAGTDGRPAGGTT